MLFRPFKALRPVLKYADKVISPPYDVLDAKEAKLMAGKNDISFLHISKPEIDLPEDTDPYSNTVYEKGADNLKTLINNGVLIKDDTDCYYVYRITFKSHVQIGVAGLASADAYQRNIIKKHEFTLPVKEDDRYNQIKTLKAQTGPVLLTYRNSYDIKEAIKEVVLDAPIYDVMGPNGTRHEIWVVSDEELILKIAGAFDNCGELFIADGHHRMAAGVRVSCDMKNENPDEKEKYDGILAVAFADDEMQVLPYNRAIRDLNGMNADELISKIKEAGFEISVSKKAVEPNSRCEYGMYLEKKWYRLNYRKEISSDAVGRLDVSILSSNIFNKLFGITDLRKDKRISFIGGIRGTKELEKMVDSDGFKVAFSLFHTPVSDMIEVAEAGAIMPPKSTWFEPKLADGLLSYQI